ncbi:hypothetical protein O9929_08500 [Vibrio lentus]|nr:hypothetical protein [Vibrio lentus]
MANMFENYPFPQNNGNRQHAFVGLLCFQAARVMVLSKTTARNQLQHGLPT